MGKASGFFEYERVENGNIEPLERIKNFKEFHPVLDEEKRREQASRCMNCGVPFCQSAINLAGIKSAVGVTWTLTATDFF